MRRTFEVGFGIKTELKLKKLSNIGVVEGRREGGGNNETIPVCVGGETGVGQ